jgi:hypothetical protein
VRFALLAAKYLVGIDVHIIEEAHGWRFPCVSMMAIAEVAQSMLMNKAREV